MLFKLKTKSVAIHEGSRTLVRTEGKHFCRNLFRKKQAEYLNLTDVPVRLSYITQWYLVLRS